LIYRPFTYLRAITIQQVSELHSVCPEIGGDKKEVLPPIHRKERSDINELPAGYEQEYGFCAGNSCETSGELQLWIFLIMVTLHRRSAGGL
jgi:hypothetical protein